MSLNLPPVPDLHDPALAAQLIAILARKLSVRLRAVSSRLGQQTP